MIINEGKRDVVTVGDFPTSGFRIAAGAKAFQILSSNIYTHKVRAVLREISCNAYDAHVAANNPNPFKVHLPTYLEPWLGVRDYGTGLSEDDIRTVYTTYFFSTKTDSNDYIGALGLGSKSPFCLVESFTVTSYFGGEKRVYNCFKNSDGEPQIALLTSCASDEPRGLEVLVPGLHRQTFEFENEAISVFQFFDRLPEINSQHVMECIESNRAKYILQGDGFAFNGDHGAPRAVMGNVAYDIPYSCSSNLGMDGYIRFGIGELSFDPGREKLSLDEQTKENLSRRLNEVSEMVADQAAQQVESQPTPFLRAKMVQQMMRGPLGHRIRDSSLESYRRIRLHQLPIPSNPIKIVTKTKRSAFSSFVEHLDLLSENNFYCIDKPRMDRRVRRFVMDTGMTVVRFTEDQVEELSIDSNILSDIDTIPKIPYSGTKRSNGGSGFRVYEYVNENLESVTDQLPTGEKVFVEWHRGKASTGLNKSVNSVIRSVGKFLDLPKIFALKTISLRSVRFNKERHRGEWIEFDAYIDRELRAIVGDTAFKFPDFSKSILILGVSNLIHSFSLTDSCLTSFKTFSDVWDSASTHRDLHEIMRGILPHFHIGKEDDSLQKQAEEIFDNFPLLKFCHSNFRNLSDSEKQDFLKLLVSSRKLVDCVEG